MSKQMLRALLLVAAIGAASSWTTAPNAAATPAKKTESEIHQWLDTWTKAFTAHDTKTIMSMYAPDVFAYDVVPPLQYIGRDAYGKDYEEFLAQYDGPIDMEFSGVHIIPAGDYAIVACLEHVSGKLKNGQTSALWVRVTSVLKKTNGFWLDVHDHVSVPTDMATGKSMLDLKP